MVTTVRALTVRDLIQVNELAWSIAQKWQEWDMLRNPWLSKCDEVRQYIFANATNTTSNRSLPWKNSTHLPKLCQIRDNLHANYIAALFPNDRYISWEGDDENSDARDKRLAIESYMENKTRLGGFKTVMSKELLDLIDYGNCFGMSEFIAEKTTDPNTGEVIPGFVGPKAVRISPLDIVFNPAATSFEESPKIVRSLKTIGTLASEIEDHPEYGYMKEVWDKVLDGRHQFIGLSHGDFSKTEEFQFAGFGSFLQYFQSDYVEILDFYGDYYDQRERKLYKNHILTVVDRAHIIRQIENPSWNGTPPIHHCGWRQRQDNLWAMGPLENLIGMQYRIDHLENAKADGFDLIIHPVIKVKGYVEDFDYGPGERIFIGDDGEVEFERPDTTMLSADTQIAMYEQKMEEMAGAPKQAMGFRTPGEKTAFEVQILENGSNRVFLNKTSYFEEVFMEPLLNDMLEQARRNMTPSDTIRVMDDQFGVANFMKVSRTDIAAKGKIRPVGARRFLKNANIVQNIVQLSNSALMQDESVKIHWSGKELARLMEELLDLERYKLYGDNIRVYEQVETQKLVQAAQQQLGETAAATAGGATGGLPGGPGAGIPGLNDKNAPVNQGMTQEADRAALMNQRVDALSGKQGMLNK